MPKWWKRRPEQQGSLLSENAGTDATLRIVSSLSEIAREDWDACANPAAPRAAGAAVELSALAGGGMARAGCEEPKTTATVETAAVEYNPFLAHDFLWSLEESGAATRKTGWLGQHLVLNGPDGRPAAILPAYLKSHSMGEYVFDHGWADAYRARRRPLLPEAASIGAVHAGHRPPAPGQARSRRGTQPDNPCPRRDHPRPPAQRIVGPRHLPAGGGMAMPRRSRLPAANRPAVPFPQSGLSRLRGLPRGADLAQAQGDPPRAPRRARRRHRGRPAHRRRSHRGRLGRLLRLLHGHRLAEMGPPLPQPALLLAPQRAHGRPRPADPRPAQRPADRRRPQPDRLRTPFTAATGVPSRTSLSSTSSSATTRRSNGASRTASPGSRPARRASTSSPAATAR